MRDRAPIVIRNRSNYFDYSKDKTHIRLNNPNSYKFACSKEMAYKTRLYYEYKYTESVGGQSFFYTLTYNDAHIPKDPFLGLPCFDYKDLARFLNGGFKKQLERKYSTKLKYFVGAELGDGKGKRGLANNPHYHVIFFLTPKDSSYKVISPLELRHLVRLYWQGADQSQQWIDYNKFELGLAKEGSYNLGKICDFRACVYASKYVTKDVSLRKREPSIKAVQFAKYVKDGVPFSQIDELIREDINTYRRECCNKVRISHGVGLSAIDEIQDYMNPLVPVPNNDGFLLVKPSLYYYRKIYNDVCKDANGQNIYVLNDVGIQYKMHCLDLQIDSIKQQVKTNVSLLDRQLFEDVVASDLCEVKDITYDDFKNIDLTDDIYERYAVYKQVYEGRYFFADNLGYLQCCEWNNYNYHRDYFEFIQPSYYSVDYNPYGVADFLERRDESFVSYCSHPFFDRFYSLFTFFDCLSDYLFVQSDVKKEDEANKRREIKRFHTGIALDNYLYNLI